MDREAEKTELLGAELKAATAEDAGQIHALVQRTIRAAYPGCYEPAVVDAFSRLHSPDAIARDVEAGKVLALWLGGRIVGTGTLDGNHITRVFVLPEEQGKGLGTLMMDELEAVASEGHGTAALDASIPARKLYLHRGYLVSGVVTWEIEPHGEHPAAALEYEVMEKVLR